MSRRVEQICALGLQQATLDNVDATVSIMSDVSMERALQDHQWGGTATDDTRLPADWANYIHHQLSKMFQEEGSERDRFVKVAALAVAAIQSLDRQQPQPGCVCPACQLERLLDSGEGGVKVIKVDSPAQLAELLSRLSSRLGGQPG